MQQKVMQRWHAKAGPATDGIGQLTVYGAVYGNTDAVGDVIEPHAFDETIAALKARASDRGSKYVLPLLHEHTPGEQLGGWKTLTSDSFGLKASGDLVLSIPRASQLYQLALAGAGGDQWSIMYDIAPNGYHYSNDGTRHLTNINLFSIDSVSFAANSATKLVSVKERNMRQTKASIAMALRQHVNTLRKAADNRDYKAVRRVADEIEDNYLTVPENIPEDMANLFQGSVPTFAGYDNNGQPLKSRSSDPIANIRANSFSIREWK